MGDVLHALALVVATVDELADVCCALAVQIGRYLVLSVFRQRQLLDEVEVPVLGLGDCGGSVTGLGCVFHDSVEIAEVDVD